VTQREQALIGPTQRAALDAINIELDNVQAAWHKAADRRAWRLLGDALQGLYRFYHIRSRYSEGKEHFAYALQQLTQSASGAENSRAALHQRLLARLGAFHLALGELDAAEAAFAVVLRESTAPHESAFVYALLGSSSRIRGQRQAAQSALQQSLTLTHASGDQNRKAKAYLGLADVASSFCDFAEGERYAREALALCRQLQRPDLTANAVAALAWAVNSQGAYGESEGYYHESLAIAETIGNPFSIGLAIQFLGWVAFCTGGDRLLEALAQYERAIAIFAGSATSSMSDSFDLSTRYVAIFLCLSS
jgi:tetratricopeptide (TPR) repeat protein